MRPCAAFDALIFASGGSPPIKRFVHVSACFRVLPVVAIDGIVLLRPRRRPDIRLKTVAWPAVAVLVLNEGFYSVSLKSDGGLGGGLPPLEPRSGSSSESVQLS